MGSLHIIAKIVVFCSGKPSVSNVYPVTSVTVALTPYSNHKALGKKETGKRKILAVYSYG